MSISMASFTGGTIRWIKSRAPARGTTRGELVAGLPGAISSVPDGMASSVLAGVNPVHGLYASAFGPIGGGLTSSTRLMVITTTSAASLAAGSALSSVPSEDRARALFLLTVLAGGLMVLAGLFHLGRYTRFVPHSVMIGFLSGIGANIIFGQLSDFFGIPAEGPFALARAIDVLTNLGDLDAGTTLAGAGALILLAVLASTRLGAYSALIALIVPSLVIIWWGSDDVQRVSDVGAIPSGLPMPTLPHLSDLSFAVLTGAFAVAALVLIQGAGVSESAPNPDDTRSDPNQDFVAQGIGNLASGVFRGQPVGGSVGQTALNVSAGAVGRWGAIFSGIWMLVILVAFSGLVGKVVMSTLAAVLIYAAIGSFRKGEVLAILRTGRNSQIGVISTFLTTLFLPVAAAIGVGVALALLMQINQEAIDLRVVELSVDAEGKMTERPARSQLESRRVALLDIYGSLFYAGARTLQAYLPDPSGCEHPAVVIRLRGRAILGATSFSVLSDYAQRLASVGGRLYLSGIDPGLHSQLRRNRTVELAGEVIVIEATATIGESSLEAYRAAEAWLEDLE
jgi:sulfate permease, SulP family